MYSFKQYPILSEKAMILISHSRRPSKLEGKGKANKQTRECHYRRSKGRDESGYNILNCYSRRLREKKTSVGGKAKSYEIRAHELPLTPLEKVLRRKATLNTPFINAKTPLDKLRRKAPDTAKAIKALQREVHSMDSQT